MQGRLLKNICGFNELIKLVILVTGRLLSCVGSSKYLPSISLSFNSYSPGCPQKPSVETPGMMAVDTRKSAGQLFQAPWGQQGPMMVTVKLEEDHPKNQGLSLPENQLPAREIFRQQFRHFCYQDSPGPWLALSRLQELCHQWLRPETHAKEEILDLLVLEQFLSILPQELQVSVREHHPESGEEAVTELENLERKRNVHIRKRQV